MSNDPKDSTETPIERALRMKRAALAAKAKRPRDGKLQPKQAARMAAGASKPAMRK
jgi:hypothetical protein